MKKYFKFIAFAILSFFFTSTTVFAREMTVEDLGNEAIKYKENTQYIYVIGHYAFTSDHNLTQQDIMLAARSIKADAATDGYTGSEPIYQKMSVQTITPKYSGFDITGWQATDNLVGSTKLDTKFDIRYIDYKFYAEISKAELDVTIPKTTYDENLKTLSFEGGNDSHTENLELKNGKLTGLVLKHESMEDTVFSGDDKTGYYFAFLVKVPNVKDETTVTLKGAKGTTSAKGTDFDTQGENGALLILWSVDPKTPKDQRKIVVTVDYDGEGTEYEGTEYTIDYSDLRYQEESKVIVSYEENLISEEDKNTITDWGYTLLGDNKHYNIESNGADNKYKVTGKVEKQTLRAGGWSSTEQKDYFFIFTLKKPDDLEKVPDGVKVTVTGTETKTFDKTFFNENGLYVNLYKLNSDCKTSSNCKITVKVDWDGDAGKEYLESSEIEIDYSGLTFVKGSDYTVKSIKDETGLSGSLKEDFGWTEPTGFDINFDQTGNTVKVTGLLPILEKFEDEQHPFGGDAETGYYLPFAIKTDTNKITEGSNKTTVKFIHEDDTEKTITGDSFDGDDVLYVLRHLDPKDTTRTFKVVVDMDGDGEEYSPYTLTFDWSELKLQEVSKASIEQNNIAQKDKEQFTTWGYDFDANQGMTFVDGNGETKVSGKLVEQRLDNAVFGAGKEDGFYFVFTIETPDGTSKDKVKVQRMNGATGDSVKKEFPASDIDENGNLTILYRFEPTQTKCDSNCKLYYKVDLDGDEHQYLPKMVVLDYSGLTFEKTSIFEVSALEEEHEEDFADKNNWYDKEHGYSVKVVRDTDKPHTYKVSGVLPVIDDSSYEDPFDPSETLYYLGLKLKVTNPSGIKDSASTEGGKDKINVKFYHGDEEDTRFLNVMGSELNTKGELYILKALKATGSDGAGITAADKTFDIVLDLDGEGTEYIPYIVTIDWSDLVLQATSAGNFGNYDVIENKDLTETSQEKKDLEKYNFDFSNTEGVELDTINDPENGNRKQGLKGTIKEQTLNAGTFDEDKGYFVPVKIEFPGKDIPELEKYKDKWTIILNTEKNTTKEYKPTKEEYDQGWVLVLFKVYKDGNPAQDKNNEKMIRYQIDYDGTPVKGQDGGYEFLPEEYTISYSSLSFSEAHEFKFNGIEGSNSTIILHDGDKITEEMLPEETPEVDDEYHNFAYWANEQGTNIVGTVISAETADSITVEPHWNLYSDKFIADVLADLNSTDEGSKSQDFSKEFKIEEYEENSGEITINVLDPRVNVSRMNDTSIPGAIAYILLKDEIKEITLTVNGQQKTFTKDSGTDQDTLKSSIKSEAQSLYNGLLSTNFEGKNDQQVTLSDLAHNENMKSFTLTIDPSKVDKSVSLVKKPASKGISLMSVEDVPTTYTFTFESDAILVNDEASLNRALTSGSAKTIFIGKSFSVENPIIVSKSVTITAGDEVTLTAGESADSIFDVTSNNVKIENLTLSTEKNTAIKLTSGSLTVDNVKVTGSKEAAITAEAGTLTVTKLTFDGETYQIPAVKAKKDGSVTVNLTDKNEGKASKITKEKVTTYETLKAQGQESGLHGDKKETDSAYDYYNYYNDSTNSHIYEISFRILEGYFRATTFTRLTYAKEKPTKPVADLNFKDFSYEQYDYKLLGYSSGSNASFLKGESECQRPENVNDAENLPVATSNATYFAAFCISVKEGAKEITSDNATKAFLDALKDSQVKEIHVTKGANIDLTTFEDQESTYSDILSDGVLTINRKVGIYGDSDADRANITVKQIKVTTPGVVLNRVNLTSKAAESQESIIEVNVSESSNSADFTLWQSNITNSENSVKYAINYKTATKANVDVRWSKFEGNNISEAYINVEHKLGARSDIFLNTFGDISTDNSSSIIINGVESKITDQSDSVIIPRIDGNTHKTDYALKIPATSASEGSEIRFPATSTRKVALEISSESEDFSSYDFVSKNPDNITFVYLKDGQTQEPKPEGVIAPKVTQYEKWLEENTKK